ncbi:hypothetical protein F503_00247 [Ophiostoma piceae UAMH 11346]|uniref:ER membrane protein complex subunit 1 n=1 Tax=Ophiostoma piceae (strain UAMH 11346) TaxID=1262450 RepID=S3D2L0_OPHP1|nr:hypothetical protein F503_00247 [Ophiostoma piceae UAMH 11346]
MRSLRAALGLLLAATATEAIVHRDQVDDIDFHHELLGLPHRDTTFFQRPRPDDKASLLYTLSDAGVLGAVNPSTGAVVWRQLLRAEEDTSQTTYGSVQAVDDAGWMVAGLGSSVHAWDSVSGRNVWWQDFAGDVGDVAVAAAPALSEKINTKANKLPTPRKDVLAASYEDAASQIVLRRLAGNDGRVVWEYRESAKSPAVLNVASADDKAHVVFASAAAGLKVLTVDALTGHRIEEHSLASDAHTAKDVLFVGSGIVAWTDSSLSKVKVSVLGTKQKSEFALPADTTEVLVHALPASYAAPLHFLVHTRTADAHRAQVFHVTDAKKGTVQKVYDLPQAPGAGAFAVSVGDAANILFTRVTDDEIVLVDSASHGILGRWPVADKTPLHALGVATAEIVVKDKATEYAIRVAVLTADEDWVLLRNNGQRAWTRHEGLTGTVKAVLVERPESEQLVRALEEEEAKSPLEAYIHRVQRHFDDLEKLPAFLQSVPAKLISSIFGGDSSSSDKPDVFGFHQIAILATRRGRLYALDASSPGTVLWTVKAVDLENGKSWAVKQIHVDEATGIAIVVAATASQSVAVKCQTGEKVADVAALSIENTSDTIASAVMVNSAAGPWLLTVSEDGQVPTDVTADKCPKEVLTVFPASSSVIHGVQYVLASGKCTPETTWTFTAPPQFRIVNVATRPAHDPVASIGRVLGDRRVLYKYLNPNLAVVAGLNDKTGALLIFLLDTVSGQVLSTSTYSGVDGTKPVECLLFENTFTCTFFADYATDEQPAQGIKGYHLTVSDIYESLEPNNRGLSGDNNSNSGKVSAYEPLDAVLGSDSAESLLPAVVSHTFVLGSRLSALAVSQTRQGVTVRQVLAYLPRVNGIIGIPRVGGVLDARRPVGRDVTPAEMEEGLSRYMPAIEVDPRWVVSHERQVVGIQSIVTAATHVESTSLVLAFGAVDVFGTRVAPSLAFDLLDKGFGKLQMLGTVVALAIGVFVLRPMVTKKQINLRWKAPL